MLRAPDDICDDGCACPKRPITERRSPMPYDVAIAIGAAIVLLQAQGG